MANIQPTVDALDQPTVMLQIRKIAGTVDSNLEAVNDEMANIQEQIDQMEDVSGRVTTLENEMDTVQSDLTAVENKNTEQDSAISDNAKGLITASELTYTEGVLTLKLTKQNGNLTETVDVPFFKTVTLMPTSTERAFKLQFTMWDNSVYDTNEFVIPAGGGTDVSVTGVTVGEGASDNTFKVSIQLSDASTIASNDYPFPVSITNPYPTDVTLSLSGNTLNCNIVLSDNNHVDGSVDFTSILSAYATTSYVNTQVASKLDKTTADGYYQPKGDYLTSVPIGGTDIGGVKNGGNVTINSDGTMTAKSGGGSGGTWEQLTTSGEIYNKFNNAQIGDEFILYRFGDTQTTLILNSHLIMTNNDTSLSTKTFSTTGYYQTNTKMYNVCAVEYVTDVGMFNIKYINPTNNSIQTYPVNPILYEGVYFKSAN